MQTTIFPDAIVEFGLDSISFYLEDKKEDKKIDAIFPNATIKFGLDSISFYQGDKKIGAIYLNRRNMLWTCECSIPKYLYKPIKHWVYFYDKRCCDETSCIDYPLSKTISQKFHRPKEINKDDLTVSWTYYGDEGINGAVQSVRDFWLALNEHNQIP